MRKLNSNVGEVKSTLSHFGSKGSSAHGQDLGYRQDESISTQ